MSNREDWHELVREIMDQYNLNAGEFNISGILVKLSSRLERELHNAFVAGQEHEERELSRLRRLMEELDWSELVQGLMEKFPGLGEVQDPRGEIVKGLETALCDAFIAGRECEERKCEETLGFKKQILTRDQLRVRLEKLLEVI